MEHKTVLEHLLGTIPLTDYVAGMIFSFIGTLISLYIHAQKRNKSNPDTPTRFSFRFLLVDNLVRLVANFLIAFIAFRFANELLGKQFDMWYALLLGLCFDNVIYALTKLEEKSRKQTSERQA